MRFPLHPAGPTREGSPRRLLGSRPLAAREASLDPGDDRHQVGDGINDVMGAGAVKSVFSPGAPSHEVFRRQRFRVGERKAEGIAADRDADRPGARVDAFGDPDRRVVDLDGAPRGPDIEIEQALVEHQRTGRPSAVSPVQTRLSGANPCSAARGVILAMISRV